MKPANKLALLVLRKYPINPQEMLSKEGFSLLRDYMPVINETSYDFIVQETSLILTHVDIMLKGN